MGALFSALTACSAEDLCQCRFTAILRISSLTNSSLCNVFSRSTESVVTNGIQSVRSTTTTTMAHWLTLVSVPFGRSFPQPICVVGILLITTLPICQGVTSKYIILMSMGFLAED